MRAAQLNPKRNCKYDFVLIPRHLVMNSPHAPVARALGSGLVEWERMPRLWASSDKSATPPWRRGANILSWRGRQGCASPHRDPPRRRAAHAMALQSGCQLK
jgi:hypothetical protein